MDEDGLLGEERTGQAGWGHMALAQPQHGDRMWSTAAGAAAQPVARCMPLVLSISGKTPLSAKTTASMKA